MSIVAAASSPALAQLAESTRRAPTADKRTHGELPPQEPKWTYLPTKLHFPFPEKMYPKNKMLRCIGRKPWVFTDTKARFIPHATVRVAVD